MAAFDGFVYLILTWGALALTGWAFIDALIRPAAGFVAAGKLTKPGWAAITGIAIAVVYFFGPMSFPRPAGDHRRDRLPGRCAPGRARAAARQQLVSRVR
jgi:hypothetical protein